MEASEATIRGNVDSLMKLIAALDDRLSAVQGLIDLGRPHIIRVH